MSRQFVISVVAMFVLSMGFGFLIHGTILHGDYAKLPNLMRSEAEAQKLFGLMFLANFMIALGPPKPKPNPPAPRPGEQ